MNDQELTEFAGEHLLYEIEQLIWTTQALVSLSFCPIQDVHLQFLFNNLLDSFTIYARTLFDFLYLGSDPNRTPRSTDIIVQQYVDPIALANCLPPKTLRLQQLPTKANKQAAHLTSDRLNYDKVGKEWDYRGITDDIMAAFRAIAPSFPESRVTANFRHLLSQPCLKSPAIRFHVTPIPNTEINI